MKNISTFSLFFVCAGLVIAGGDPAIQKDLKLMTGTWQVASYEENGKQIPSEQLVKTKYIFAANGKLMVQKDGKTVMEADLKIDPAQKPKQAELVHTLGDMKGKALPAIYEVEGNTLKLCYGLGKDRPKEFASKPGSGHVLIALQREIPPKLFASSSGMKFIWIAPGTFVMGSQDKEDGRNRDEAQHKVQLTKGFFMGIYPVTQEQWQKVMASNPSHFRDDKNLPVENVSWEDCQQFCKKLSDMDKKPYRLPTEAEWEYACRAGTTSPFHFGPTLSTDQANFNGEPYGKSPKGFYRAQTTPVGSFPANAWGLHDMHGNVWEWCQDWYGDYPKDAVDPQGPPSGKVRVVRGGARFNSPDACRSASRHWYLPDYRGSYIGFRVCFTE